MSKYLLFFLICVGIGGILFWVLSPSKDVSTGLWTFRSQEKQIPMTYAESLSLQKQTGANANVLYNDAISNMSATGCVLIPDASLQTRCQDVIQATVAQQQWDIVLCQWLSDSGSRSNCEDGIVLAQAESKMDREACNAIHEEHLRLNCQKSVDEKRLQTMSVSGQLSPEFCQTLHEDFRSACKKTYRDTNDTETYRNAIAGSDVNMCEKIYATEQRNTCIDAILFQKAMKTSDSTICESMRDAQKRMSCLTATVRQTDTNAFQLIVGQGNIDECEKIQDVSLKNQCHDMILMKYARENKDYSVCSSLRNTGLQFPCVQMTKQ